jgi:hypothetical protein
MGIGITRAVELKLFTVTNEIANPGCGKLTVSEILKVPMFTAPLMVVAGKAIRSQGVVVVLQDHQHIYQAKRFSGPSGTRQLLVATQSTKNQFANPGCGKQLAVAKSKLDLSPTASKFLSQPAVLREVARGQFLMPPTRTPPLDLTTLAATTLTLIVVEQLRVVSMTKVHSTRAEYAAM